MKSVIFVLLAGIAMAVVPQFHIEGGQKKCFIEMVPPNTQIYAAYRTKGVGSEFIAGVGLKVWVLGPQGNRVHEERQALSSGVMKYKTTEGGEFKICVQTNTTKWFTASDIYHVRMDVRSGVQATDYADIAKKEELSSLEVAVRVANDRLTNIHKEQLYQKQREESFRDITDSTYYRIIFMAFLQIVVFVACAIWEAITLQNFFKKKKFV